jgi:hypothetical protein
MASGGMVSHRLFVLHIEEGTEAGTDAWQHNPAAQVSSHFGNPKSAAAPMDQFVDTDDRAWAEAAYNNVAISVEHEGNSGDSLTPAQLERDAQLLAWCHTTHGTKLQVTDDPNGAGVIGHGLLGVAGGNHPDCPGAPILAQRQAIVDRAAAILNPAPTSLEDDMPEIISVTPDPTGAAGNTGSGIFAVYPVGVVHVDGATWNGPGYQAKYGPAQPVSPAYYASLVSAAAKAAVSLTDAQVQALGAAIAAGIKLPAAPTGFSGTFVD